MYNAQLLEQGIANLFVGLQCLGKSKPTWGDVGMLYDQADKKTLGQLLRVVGELVPFDPKLEGELKDALDKRNYLTHLFFVEHVESTLSETGIRRMIDELLEIITFFKTVDSQVDKLWVAIWSKYILPDEKIQREFDAVKRAVQGKE